MCLSMCNVTILHYLEQLKFKQVTLCTLKHAIIARNHASNKWGVAYKHNQDWSFPFCQYHFARTSIWDAQGQ